jgi:hypothetical protein
LVTPDAEWHRVLIQSQRADWPCDTSCVTGGKFHNYDKGIASKELISCLC